VYPGRFASAKQEFSATPSHDVAEPINKLGLVVGGDAILTVKISFRIQSFMSVIAENRRMQLQNLRETEAEVA
jgi:hypothetical protein